jgi:hypothetical protein
LRAVPRHDLATIGMLEHIVLAATCVHPAFALKATDDLAGGLERRHGRSLRRKYMRK